jgi:hypothetical protein
MPEADQNQFTPPVPAPQPPRPAPRPAEQVGLRVSLIPTEEINKRDPRAGFKHCLLAIGIALILIIGVIVFLAVSVYMAKAEVAKINAQTDAYNAQTDSLANSLKDAKLTQARLRALGSLLGSHRSAEPVFSFLEQHTLSDVAFSSIAISESGLVNLAAAAGSFESYAAQINELRSQSTVKSLVSSGLSPVYDTNGNLQQVNFALSITFDQSIFVSPAAGK